MSTLYSVTPYGNSSGFPGTFMVKKTLPDPSFTTDRANSASFIREGNTVSQNKKKRKTIVYTGEYANTGVSR